MRTVASTCVVLLAALLVAGCGRIGFDEAFSGLSSGDRDASTTSDGGGRPDPMDGAAEPGDGGARDDGGSVSDAGRLDDASFDAGALDAGAIDAGSAVADAGRCTLPVALAPRDTSAVAAAAAALAPSTPSAWLTVDVEGGWTWSGCDRPTFRHLFDEAAEPVLRVRFRATYDDGRLVADATTLPEFRWSTGGPELLAAAEAWGGGAPTEVWYFSAMAACEGCDASESILLLRFDATFRLLLLTGRYVQE